MLFNGKLIEQIQEEDLLSLIGIETESQTLDFKEHAYPTHQDQNGKTAWDKVEFCADLSSFANAFGGWIICGIKEKKGEATDLCGLGSNIDIDREIGRLQQAANSGIEPRLPTLRFHAVSLSDPNKSKVLLIYIGRSFIGPHRVKETGKFHLRRSNGKGIEMNVDELRIAFNLADSMTERVKSFRKERVDVLNSPDAHEDIPVVLEEGPRLVLHSIPLPTLSLGIGISIPSFEFATKALKDSNLLSVFTMRARFNFDGVVLPNFYEDERAAAYFQVFRSGAIEFVDVARGYKDKQANPYEVEDITLAYLEIMLNMQKHLDIDPPHVIMLSLSGFKGYRWWFKEYRLSSRFTSFERDIMLIPDIVVNNYDDDIKKLLKPIFDIMWNVGGLKGSQSYDSEGNWIRKGYY